MTNKQEEDDRGLPPQHSVEVQPAKPKIKVYNFADTIRGMTVFFQISVLDQCVWVWIGSILATCNSLAVAIPTKYSNVPMSTEIVKGANDGVGKAIAQRLAKRLSANKGNQHFLCFVSYNLQEPHLAAQKQDSQIELLPNVQQLVEKQLLLHIKELHLVSQEIHNK